MNPIIVKNITGSICYKLSKVLLHSKPENSAQDANIAMISH